MQNEQQPIRSPMGNPQHQLHSQQPVPSPIQHQMLSQQPVPSPMGTTQHHSQQPIPSPIGTHHQLHTQQTIPSPMATPQHQVHSQQPVPSPMGTPQHQQQSPMLHSPMMPSPQHQMVQQHQLPPQSEFIQSPQQFQMQGKQQVQQPQPGQRQLIQSPQLMAQQVASPGVQQMQPQKQMSVTPSQSLQGSPTLNTAPGRMGGADSIHTSREHSPAAPSRGSVPSTPPNVPQSQPPPGSQISPITLSRFGQEIVNEIVSKVQDLFQLLKNLQPPNGTPAGFSISHDKRVKIQENLRNIKLLFKKARIIYMRCNEGCQMQGMEFVHIESLISMRGLLDPKLGESKSVEVHQSAVEERKELMQQVRMKNRHLKDIMKNLRRIIWEINTMLAMRKA